MLMDYGVIVDATHGLTLEGWKREEVVRADGYPVYVLTDPKHEDIAMNRPSMLIAAGIHGEEPGAVVGLKKWLIEHAGKWVGQVRFSVFPCLNPWGYERGIRYCPEGKDLNREFDAPVHPTVRAFNDWLATKHFDLFMDLHEDSDFETMYLYDVRLRNPKEHVEETLGHRILKRAEKRVGLSHGDTVGEAVTERGLIAGDMDPEETRSFSGRPIAIHVYSEYTKHVVTVETPGLLPLDLRAKLHVEALEEACAYLVEMAASNDN